MMKYKYIYTNSKKAFLNRNYIVMILSLYAMIASTIVLSEDLKSSVSKEFKSFSATINDDRDDINSILYKHSYCTENFACPSVFFVIDIEGFIKTPKHVNYEFYGIKEDDVISELINKVMENHYPNKHKQTFNVLFFSNKRESLISYNIIERLFLIKPFLVLEIKSEIE